MCVRVCVDTVRGKSTHRSVLEPRIDRVEGIPDQVDRSFRRKELNRDIRFPILADQEHVAVHEECRILGVRLRARKTSNVCALMVSVVIIA